MSFLAIKKTLLNSYIDGAFGLSTAYENRKFEPVRGTNWAEVYILPNQPSVFSMGGNGSDEHDGVMQINLNYQQDKGDGAALAKAEQIALVYQAGKFFTHAGQVVSIKSCGRQPGRIVDGYFQIIININWTARTVRS
jgi:hypothetical protein